MAKRLGMGLLMVVGLAQAAFADEPTPALPSPAALGQMEAVLAFCAKTDSKAAAKYSGMLREVSQMAPAGELAALRATDDYRQAYEAAADSAVKLDAKAAVQACGQYLGAT
jgi:hypothetical protein